MSSRVRRVLGALLFSCVLVAIAPSAEAQITKQVRVHMDAMAVVWSPHGQEWSHTKANYFLGGHVSFCSWGKFRACSVGVGFSIDGEGGGGHWRDNNSDLAATSFDLTSPVTFRLTKAYKGDRCEIAATISPSYRMWRNPRSSYVGGSPGILVGFSIIF